MEARQQKINRDIELRKNALKEKGIRRSSSIKDSSVMRAWAKEESDKLH